MKVKIYPLEKKRWKDLEELFGEKGACGGCWCMYWRLRNKDFNLNKGEGNKKLLKKLVIKGEPLGLLAYLKGKPIGWCAIAPREKYLRLSTSKILGPVDDKVVWSISCFFVKKEYRRKGLTLELIKAAIDYGKKKGAKIIESYSVDPQNKDFPYVFACVGFYSAFRKTGFKEVARRSLTRPIMRYNIR